MTKKDERKCSFCGRPESQVPLLLQGVSGFICSDCIENGHQLLTDNNIIKAASPKSTGKATDEVDIKKVPKPIDIKNYLDQYVIGQDDAKKYLSVAVYNHYKRLTCMSSFQKEDIDIQKSNIIIVGPTGTGKTLLARSIAKLLDVPFCIVDATVFTEAGYVGEDVESILSRLLQAADYDQERAEKGIVFIDEIDKIARKSDNPSITRDVSGEGVQQSILKLLEGTVVNVPPKGGRKHPDQDYVHMDTKNILFICGGAFDNIERKIAQRLNTHTLGYSNSKDAKRVDESNIISLILPCDLRSFGLIPELIGRLPIVTYLNQLDKEALRKILTEPKDSIIKQFQTIFSMDGVRLTFSEETLDFIVQKALENKLGARGLRGILENIMMNAMFEIPSMKIEEFDVSLDYAKKQLDKKDV